MRSAAWSMLMCCLLSARAAEPLPISELPGAPVRVGDVFLPCDLTRVHEDPDREGVYLAVVRPGVTGVVAATIGDEAGDRRTSRSAAALLASTGLTSNEWADVVALSVQVDMTPAVVEALASLPQVRFLSLKGSRIGLQGHLPPLPRSIELLHLRETSNTEPVLDFASLRQLDRLGWLLLSLMGDANPFADLKGAGRLRFIDVQVGLDDTSARALGALAQVEELNLEGQPELRGKHLAGLKSLRRLNISQSAVDSLAFAGALPQLEVLRADCCAARELPEGPCVALRELSILSVKVPAERVAAFRKAHPHCVVRAGWMELLRGLCDRADGVRVRSGGTCHRRPGEERVLFELKGPAAAAEFLGKLVVDDARSGFHCMCCGDPTFEILEAGRVVASLGYHHGRSLRAGGIWPGDALLAVASQDYLADLLARHGLDEPRKELQQAREQEKASERLKAQYETILAKDGAGGLLESGSREAFSAAFSKLELATCLRLYGCGGYGWEHACGLDQPLSARLGKELSKADVHAVWTSLGADETARLGLARWLYGDEGLKRVSPERRQAVLRETVSTGLDRPHAASRRQVLRLLAEMPSEDVAAALLERARDWRAVPEPATPAPDGSVVFRPDRLPDNVDEQTVVLWVLAKTGVRDARALIEKRRTSASGADAKVLDEAVRLLDGAAPAR